MRPYRAGRAVSYVRTVSVADDLSDWEADVVLSDGGTVHFRPVRPDDADRLVAFHGRLSPETIYFRFFSPRPIGPNIWRLRPQIASAGVGRANYGCGQDRALRHQRGQ